MVRCCFCGAPARGRYNFLNSNDEVIDNPFCSQHNTDVFWQTKRSLASMHSSASISRQYLTIDRWDRDELPPPLPKNKQELLSKGAIYVH